MIVAIDGPAGSGKSTVAKLLSKKLGYLYIDTGAMYRALTLKALNTKQDICDEEAIVQMAKKTKIGLIDGRGGALKVLLDGKNVSKAIREPRVTSRVSDVAKIKGVRDIMLKLQRKLGNRKNSVLEGRDIGTVVFPKAERKFFLDADFAERVKRRLIDMKNLKIKKATLGSVASDLKNRDTIDSTRKVAPLKKAKDAIFVDTTNLTIDEVVETLLGHVKGKTKT
ncbi:MAG: (d)CMP kinase [Candidatus Omnitrophica bacterium]|nr:(d)CMP kinase [Candidatus Omnitrophota bacterium]